MPHSRHILLAEDSEEDVILVRRAFRNAGITDQFHSVASGEEAIAYLSHEGKYADQAAFPLPSLLITDLKMPGKSGFDVVRWVRQHPALKRMIVIVLTSSTHRRDVDLCYELGVNSYLVKPVNASELFDLVGQIKACWLFSNQVPSVDT